MVSGSDIQEILENVTIISATEYRVRQTKVDLNLDPGYFSIPSPLSPKCDDILVRSLKDQIYMQLYCRLRNETNVASNNNSTRHHVSALSAANCGVGTWEAGWQFNAFSDGGMAVVSRDRVKFWMPFQNVRSGVQHLQQGDLCQVRVPKEMRQLASGFYLAMGNEDMDTLFALKDVLVRLYWNLSSEAAVPFISAITNGLNELSIPFRAKVISNPTAFCRADAAVLCLEKRFLGQAESVLRTLYNSIGGSLHSEVPMFTKMVAKGVGYAEDPKTGESFGQSRCRLLASALVKSFSLGITSCVEQRSIIDEHFVDAGFKSSAPYLDRGSDDILLDLN